MTSPLQRRPALAAAFVVIVGAEACNSNRIATNPPEVTPQPPGNPGNPPEPPRSPPRNPPAPLPANPVGTAHGLVPLPPDWDLERRADGTCWGSPKVHCPPGVPCNPPTPMPVACPATPDSPPSSNPPPAR